MKIDIIESTPTTLKMVVKGTKPSIVNALRRSILAEVPVMGIDEVIMYENTSVMTDEYIAHRLAMIPFKTDLKTYKMPSDCCGGKCASCSADFSIDISGPKIVYSSDLKTSDAKIKPVSGKIPIIKLGSGQRLRLEAKAVLGIAEQHVKWQAGNAAYKYLAEISVDNRKTFDAKKVNDVCPAHVYKVSKGKLEIANEFACTGCKLCEAASDGAIQVNHNREAFVFKIETNGQITAKQAAEVAIEKIKERLTAMKKLIQ